MAADRDTQQEQSETKIVGSNTRRDFIKSSSLLVAGGVATGMVGGQLSMARAANVQGSDEIKIATVGCGGRGTAATMQALNTSGPVKLVAMADAFEDRLQASYRGINGKYKDQVDVPEDRRHVGFDGYQKVLESEADLVILATPPGFRPLHFEKAVEAGKHIFMEKPVATDAPGVRRILAANEIAKKNGQAVAVGLQRHHETIYKTVLDRLHDGDIGDINMIRSYWNGNGVWVRPRKDDQTELEYQMRNWYYFNWLCGDHINEQHIHNIDVGNWVKQGHPVKAQGMGGREVREGLDYGQIFDHHAVEFTYEDGSKMFSQCRHIPGCWGSVSEAVHGTKGWAQLDAGKIFDVSDVDGKTPRFAAEGKHDGHQQEHHDLFGAIRRGEIPNEGEYGAHSTMTAILGRMCTYSGKEIKWDDAINSELSLADTDNLMGMDSEAPLKPDADGKYDIPVPGKYKPLG